MNQTTTTILRVLFLTYWTMLEQERCCFKLAAVNTIAAVFVCRLERFFCLFRVKNLLKLQTRKSTVLFRVCSFSQFFQSYLTIFVNVVNVKLVGEGSYRVWLCVFRSMSWSKWYGNVAKLSSPNWVRYGIHAVPDEIMNASPTFHIAAHYEQDHEG